MGFRSAKSEIRISKSETISKFKEEIAQTKLPGHRRRFLVLNFLSSLIRICFGFRISDFGFGPRGALDFQIVLVLLLVLVIEESVNRGRRRGRGESCQRAGKPHALHTLGEVWWP